MWWDIPEATVLLRAGFRSAAADADGIAFGISQTTPGTPVYSADGCDFDATAKAIRFNLASNRADQYPLLRLGGRLSFRVPTAVLDAAVTPASTKYFVTKSAGYLEKHSGGYLRSRFPQDGSMLPDLGRWFVNPVLKPDVSEVLIAWNEHWQYLFINGLPIQTTNGVRPAVSEYTDLYIGGLTGTAGSYPAGYPISDVVLSSHPFYYSPSLAWGRHVFFGDSLLTQGSLNNNFRLYAYVPWDPGHGFQSGGAPNTNGAFTGDAGLIPEYFRTLMNGGLMTGRNANEAKSGDNSTACLARAEAWFAASTNNRADVAVVLIGTNDVAQQVATATYANNLSNLVGECLEHDIKRVVVGTIPSLRASATYQAANFDSKIAALNEAVATLPSVDSRVSVVDCFGGLGGHGFDPTDFQSNNVHPSASGSTKLGRLLGAGALAAIDQARPAAATRPARG